MNEEKVTCVDEPEPEVAPLASMESDPAPLASLDSATSSELQSMWTKPIFWWWCMTKKVYDAILKMITFYAFCNQLSW